jgi:hypothetical protein
VEQYLPTSKSPFARCRDHPTIDDLPWRPTSLCASATRKVHGSADPMRTPTCDSIPKGADLSVYSQTHLNKVARQLNERPRKTLGIRNPSREI